MAGDPVHILGVGNLGKFLAHSLIKACPSAPVTFIMHRAGLMQQWNEANRTVKVIRDGEGEDRKGFPAESIHDLDAGSHIKHLLVTTKAHATREALMPLKSRLCRSSTILFTQNGMGMSGYPSAQYEKPS